MNTIKTILLSVVALFAVVIFAMTYETEQVKANDQICDTWSDISKECLGNPVNCLCEIEVPGTSP
jgi:hypothetical protein